MTKALLGFALLATVSASAHAQAQAATDDPSAETPAPADVAPPAPPPPATASLLVAVNADDAEVRVDGELVGTSPLAALDLSVGRHTVAVTRRGFRPASRAVDLTAEGGRVDFLLELDPEATEALAAEPEPEEPSAGSTDWYRRWYVWAGAGGVLVLTAVIIGVAASGGDGQSAYPLPPIQP